MYNIRKIIKDLFKNQDFTNSKHLKSFFIITLPAFFILSIIITIVLDIYIFGIF